MSRLTKSDLKKYQRDLMKKGWEVNQKLTDILARKNTTMSSVKMPHEMKPGMKPEEKLRLWLDQIVRAQNRLKTPEFGLCVSCGKEFDKGALDDVPWLETCEACLKDEDAWL